MAVVLPVEVCEKLKDSGDRIRGVPDGCGEKE